MQQTKLFLFIPTSSRRKEEKQLNKQHFQEQGLKEIKQMDKMSNKKFSIFTFTIVKPKPSQKIKTIGIHFSEPKPFTEIIKIIKKGIEELEKEKTNKKTNKKEKRNT